MKATLTCNFCKYIFVKKPYLIFLGFLTSQMRFLFSSPEEPLQLFSCFFSQCLDFIMASSPKPILLDLLKCIKACHPQITVSNSDYLKCAKECLVKLLGDAVPEKTVTHTAKSFVDYVRRLYKQKDQKYKSLLSHKWFKGALQWIEPSEKVPVSPSPQATSSIQTRQQSKIPFELKSKRQQDRDTQKIREENDPSAIIKAAVQLFREIGCKDAAFTLQNLAHSPEEFGPVLRKAITYKPIDVSKVSKPQANAFILDKGITRDGWEGLCKLVNSEDQRLLYS